MAGKLCFGKPTNNAGAGHLSASKAFCEGANYRAAGTPVSRPQADNPHEVDSDDYVAWNTGWALADVASPGAWNAVGTCCAPTGAVDI